MTRMLLLAVALLTLAFPARAQDFPNRTIRIIVGPSPDAFARIIAEHLQQTWGQPVVVETRPGAGGKIAATAVATAEPDGHTLLFATPSYTLNTAMKAASYDFVNDYEPVALIGIISYALVTHPAVPAKSVQELVALAKAKPGQINCASAGIGTVPHIACEVLNKAAGVNIVHVPFRSAPDAVTAVMRNDVQFYFAPVNLAKEQSEAGKVRAIAAATAQRIPDLPNVPTFTEQGLPYVYDSWFGLMAPANVSKPILEKIAKDWADATKTPEMKAKLDAQFVIAKSDTPAEFDKIVRDEIANLTQVFKEAGL